MQSIKQLQEWHTRVRIRHHAHTRSAVEFERRARFLGVLVVILSTAVGTSIFSSLGSSSSWRIVAGLLSLMAAVLSSVQALLKYPELVQLHRVAARKYGQLRRELEAQLALDSGDPGKLAGFLDSFQRKWSDLEGQTPNIPQRLYDKSRKAVISALALESSAGQPDTEGGQQ
ncbi:MAG TPA: SLATT domain-containing protein [Terriglobia bacterium]|jgi:hypothetical protein|nr:SLATT domain-containing protein [Terriglobia bacterium]